MYGWLASFFANAAPTLLGVTSVMGSVVAVVIAIGFGILRWHRARKSEDKSGVEPSHLIIGGLVGAAICLLIVAGTYGWQQYVSIVPAPKPNALAPISAEDQQFRIDLRKFVLGPLGQAQFHLEGLAFSMINITGGQSDSNRTRSLNEMMVALIYDGLRAPYDAAKIAVEKDISDIDEDTAQNAVRGFLIKYREFYAHIPRFSELSGFDYKSVENYQLWMHADAACRDAFHDIQSYPRAGLLKQIGNGMFASG